jgi:hypothetical protein
MAIRAASSPEDGGVGTSGSSANQDHTGSDRRLTQVVQTAISKRLNLCREGLPESIVVSEADGEQRLALNTVHSLRLGSHTVDVTDLDAVHVWVLAHK